MLNGGSAHELVPRCLLRQFQLFVVQGVGPEPLARAVGHTEGYTYAWRGSILRGRWGLVQNGIGKASVMTPIAPVEGLTNVRDLGGLRRTGGGRTPHGVFWRSENLDRVTARGWDQLHTAGIRTVIDLRQQAERERTPYSAPSWLSLVHVDHDGLANRGFWTA